jgi:hypothetical protein
VSSRFDTLDSSVFICSLNLVPIKSAEEHFVVNFPETKFQNIRCIHERIKKFRFIESLLHNKPIIKRSLLTEEKLNEIGARSENTPQK